MSRCAHGLYTGLPSALTPMPQPGDPCPGFVAQPGQCWQMITTGNCR